MVVALVALLLSTTGGNSNKSGLPRIHRIVLIVLENQDFDSVIGDRSARELNRLARRYALLTNYFALEHPSLPNYLALVSGSTHGVKTDCLRCMFSARNLADTLEEAHRTWKVYAEGLRARGFAGSRSGLYVKRHNPFLYFRDVASNPARRIQVVPLPEFKRDLSLGVLPDFSFVVPDLCHSTHDCTLAHGDGWLRRFLRPLLTSSQLDDGVVFVTFDEASFEDTEGGGGHIATLVLGPLVRPGARTSERLTHYNLLRTIEDAWSLPRLGGSASANPIRGIWR